MRKLAALLLVLAGAYFVAAVSGGVTPTTETTATTTTIAATTTTIATATATTLPATTTSRLSTTTTIGAREEFVFRGRMLSCGTQNTLIERVKCRLGLAKESKPEIYYVPEECRVKSGDKREACLELYDSLQSCRGLRGDDARDACAKQKINLGSIVSEKARCLTETNPVFCQSELRERVFKFAKFKFYNLERKAEVLMEKGASQELVAGFIAFIEQKKVAFNEANTIAEKKQAIKQVQAEWKSFVQKALAQIRS